MKKEHSIFGFHKLSLPIENDLFHRLSTSIYFEEVGKGRKGNHLVDIGDNGIPLVRTTSKYYHPAHRFSNVHHSIVNSIKNVAKSKQDLASLDLSFNNALIEIYDRNYFKMGYHSDQCLDLDTDSYIALFSCYERPKELSKSNLRKLKVKNKTTDETFEFSLDHHSVILFSVSTNSNFRHKIVLDTSSKQGLTAVDNKWLGITFRQSKTFIQFKNGLPYFANGEALTVADENQQRAFYKLRGQENKSIHFEYPEIAYTLSKSDVLMPIIT